MSWMVGRVRWPAGGFAIQLVTSTDSMPADPFRLAGVYTTGMVATARNGFGGVSRTVPLDGAPFTATNWAGTASPNNFYGQIFSVDWPLLYLRQANGSDIRYVDVVALTLGSAVECTAADGASISNIAVAPGMPYGFYVTSTFPTKLYRWTRADEFAALPTLLATLPSGDLGLVNVDVDGSHVWVGGGGGYIAKHSVLTGALVLSVTMPGGAYVGGMCAHPDGGLVVMTEDVPSGSFTYWYYVSPAGVVTDVTASVTVDGVAWTAIPGLYESAWGSPFINLTSYGDRIGWGGDYSYGPGIDGLKAFHGTVTGTP